MRVEVAHAGGTLAVPLVVLVLVGMHTSGSLVEAAHFDSTAAVDICSSPSICDMRGVGGPFAFAYVHGHSRR